MSSHSVTEITLLSHTKGVDLGSFSLTASDLGLPASVPINAEQVELVGGKQQGSRVITLTVGEVTVRVVPTRAMAILEATHDGVRFGWNSPVKEVVHPWFIEQESAGGLGWLDGFNEMLVRCGYQWAGHPGVDNGQLLTLHGRIQNTPADEVVLKVDTQPPYRVRLSGRVDEKRFKFTNYEVHTELALALDDPRIQITDRLKNLSHYENEYQAIYHNNFGRPILEAGARLHIPCKKISPFNAYAAQGLDQWSTMPAPTEGFDEQVFNIEPISDDTGVSYALMENADQSKGIEVAYDTSTLPVLTVWKNTDTEDQGYVVGLEPGTSYAYNRRYQRPLGLVPKLAGKSDVVFRVSFGLLTHAEEVAHARQRIQALQERHPAEVLMTPLVQPDKD
jgi:hypothetical protein